ncbi:velvet factor-domain-containing protein [Gautieria morchelliformis]|nr:velvet factor-domain-containing protein [Gautieria morchelliformis]
MVVLNHLYSNSPYSALALRPSASGENNDYSEPACRRQTTLAPDWSSSDSPDSFAGSSSPEFPAASTTSSHSGWSEGDSLYSPDIGRQYLQSLTQTKPLTLHRRTYHLVVAQHPHTAAEFGQHDMSRIPLAPPLFVRLVVRNSVGAEVSADAELPFFVARITLHSAASPDRQDLSACSELYGTTISTPHSLRDMVGAPGAYFIFPDVGVRRRGRWRLHVSLLRIAHVGSATVLRDGDASTPMAGVWTDPFEVLAADGYVAPQITTLTRHFQNQGVRMFISNSVVPR